MTLRHAATLALVGWYLLVPPHPFAATVPPPSEWSVYEVYVSAEKCEERRLAISEGMLEDAPADFVERFGNTFMYIFKQARCIATDDPRLKEK
jgi:hypothetical protein